MPQRGIEENRPGCWPLTGGLSFPRRRVVVVMLREGRCQQLLRGPAGAWLVLALPGAAPAGAGLPPANLLRCPSGTENRALATILSWSDGGHGSAKILVARAILSGARLCARSTSRSRLVAGDAADFNAGHRGFEAAAAGPRRTQPRSIGCGSAALCPSHLCSPSGAEPLPRRLSISPSRRSRVFSGLCAASRFGRR